jgi:hypothetical protein
MVTNDSKEKQIAEPGTGLRYLSTRTVGRATAAGHMTQSLVKYDKRGADGAEETQHRTADDVAHVVHP